MALPAIQATEVAFTEKCILKKGGYMKKGSFIITVISCLLLSGCLQSKEHLVINKDGSGSLETQLMVPKGTILLIDKMFGSMMKGMDKAMGGTGNTSNKMPVSAADEMFGSKQQILQQAQAKGANIKFEYFKKEKRDGNLYVRYKIDYENVAKFLSSGIFSTKIKMGKDADGNLVCAILPQRGKSMKAKMQMKQFEAWKQSAGFKKMDADTRKMIEDAFKALKIETIITMPGRIKKVSGMFTKTGPKTAEVSLSGNLLEDKKIFDEIYALSSKSSQVISDARGITFALSPYTSLDNTGLDNGQSRPLNVSAGSPVKIYLKDGKKIEGKLIEKTDKYVKIDFYGTVITYYNDEIDRIE